MRIKKIAERRTIWGGGRLRRKRGAEDHGDGREQPQERGARRLDRLHLPGGAGAQQRRPGLGHGRHPDRRTAPRLARAARIFAPPPRAGPGATAPPPHGPRAGVRGPRRNRPSFRIRRVWTSSFVLSFPARPHVGRAGPWAPRSSGSERPSSGPSCSPCTVTPTSSSYSPRVSFPLSPSAHKEFAIDPNGAV